MSWLMKHRYAVSCLLVFVVLCLHTRNGLWYGDFWEHSAVVRELASEIVRPSHPQLLLDAPHAFYSPYTVLAALLARAFRADAIGMLASMGLVNLGLWFVGLRLFVFSMVSKHRRATAFYTLILTLFWWGPFAWTGFGGFFHFGVLAYIIPYPSTFAVALAFIAIRWNQRRVETGRHGYVIAIFFVAVITLITHPLSFIFFTIGLVSQSCADRGSVLRQLILTGSLLSAVFLAAGLWPYFPVWNFFLFESGKYHFSNRLMYHQVLSKVWPALLGVPLLIASLKSDWRRPLVLMLATLSAIYGFGGISGQYAYGRLVSFIVLLLHIVIAERIAMLETTLPESLSARWFARWIVPIGVMAMGMLLFFKPLEFTINRALRHHPSTYEHYQFLSKFTGQYEVVVADIITSWMVPTFGGKVVATEHPLAFVPDYDVRRSDVERFFKRDAILAERQLIVQKYKAAYLLLNKSRGQHLLQPSMPSGRITFENKSFLLISLRPD
jgi:hypothetical protein